MDVFIGKPENPIPKFLIPPDSIREKEGPSMEKDFDSLNDAIADAIFNGIPNFSDVLGIERFSFPEIVSLFFGARYSACGSDFSEYSNFIKKNKISKKRLEAEISINLGVLVSVGVFEITERKPGELLEREEIEIRDFGGTLLPLGKFFYEPLPLSYEIRERFRKGDFKSWE